MHTQASLTTQRNLCFRELLTAANTISSVSTIPHVHIKLPSVLYRFISEYLHSLVPRGTRQPAHRHRQSVRLTSSVNRGRRSTFGRSGDCRTNVLTEIASPALCLQARSPRIVCTDPCPHGRHGPDVKKSCGDQRTSQISSAHSRPALLGIRTADGHLSPCVPDVK